MDVLYQTSSGTKMTVKEELTSLPDTLILSNDKSKDEILDFLKITNSLQESKTLLGGSYDRLSEVLMLSPDETFLSVPKTFLDERLNSFVDKLEITLEELDNRDYLVTYLTIKRFLRSLSRPLVDHKKLDSIVKNEEHEAVKKSMLSLAPDSRGLAKRSVYCMNGSNTGRLIVKEGPNILTMKATARAALKSRYNEGKILQIDISAAEPNIALNVSGKEIVRDVYKYIAEEVLGNRVSRDAAKLIVLCALYGQSPSKLQKMLPANTSARRVIQQCREFFDAHYLEKTLEASHRNNNLRNVVGRPIKLSQTDTRLLVSYFLQSSAAELSIVMFSELCDTLRSQGRIFVPLYVVHDAIIIDCDKSLSEELLRDKIINLQMGNWKFHAKVTEIS